MPESLDVRARHIFDLVIDQAGNDRAAQLERMCDGAPALRARVEALLVGAEKDDRFLAAATFELAGSTADVPTGEQPGGRIGPYTLVERIGEGGFGSVYLAEQSAPMRRQVALKIIKAGMDTRRVIARFEAERQTLALMDHPNIARVLEAGATESGRPYFVMELVRGERITAYCDRECLSVTQRLELFRDVCSAVQHAHQKGIIHRDLKPSNILVAQAERGPLAKVIDFGIAKATAAHSGDESSTDSYHLVGTPEYMSPEQVIGSAADVDTRSDIYALGVLLYELLTGMTPFDRRRMADSGFDGVCKMLREEEPPRPSLRLQSGSQSPVSGESSSGLNGQPRSASEIAQRRRTEPTLLMQALRRDLDWIVLKCLEKDRTRRYETASALADDIGRHLSHEPILAAPPSANYRFRKFVRRNRGPVLAGGAVAIVLLLGAIGTTIGMVWAFQEQRRAEEQSVIATREADQSRAVNEFMRALLTSAEPHKRGADVRLIDVLAGASESASQRFADHPLQEAQVRDLLGEICNHLGSRHAAVAEFRRAAELTREFAGENDPRTLRAEYRLMGALLDLSRTAEAEQLVGGLMPRMIKVLGADDPMTLDTRRGAAIIHQQRGRLDEAEQILMQLRAHPRLIDDDYSQIRILNALSLVHFARPHHPDRAERLAFWAQGAALARERVERALRHYGPHSPATAHARIHLAMALYRQDKFAASADVCRAVLADSAERLGECHDMRTSAMIELATVLGRTGELREPAELYLRAIACARANNPAGSMPLLVVLGDALPYLARGGAFQEGEAVALELRASLTSHAGDDMLVTADIYAAQFVSMAGRIDEADRLFEPLLADEEAIPTSYAKARLHLCYGDHLVRQGLFEQAEQHLERAVSIRGDIRTGTWTDLPDDIILGFMKLYQAWEQPEKYGKYRQMRDELCAP